MSFKERIQFVIIMQLLAIAMFLASCSNEQVEVQYRLLPADIYGGVEQIVTTKADAGYTDFQSQQGLKMGVFATGGTQGTVNGIFEYTETGWNSNVSLEAGKEYKLYIYSPEIDAASFSDNVLTLKNLSVSGTDVVISEGVAKQNETVIPGKFSFKMNANPQGQEPKDYVDIKMDHLFAQLFLEFAIEDPGNDPFKFGNLRKIEITNAELATTNSSTATITFNNGNSQQPFSVSWSEMQNSDTKVYAVMNAVPDVQSAGGLMITTEYQPYGGGFVIPTVNGTEAEMWLRVTYNVYDLNHNLVREGDISENKISVSTNLLRGTIYKKKIFIQPTYIYSLTDDDQLTLKF